jgi:hypothetical protein
VEEYNQIAQNIAVYKNDIQVIQSEAIY